MTIAGRRQVLGWGALGLGAVTLDGCGRLLPWGGKTGTGTPPDISRLLGELDAVMHRLKGLEPVPEHFGIRSGAPHVADGQASCVRLLTTLCAMGTYREIPPAMWPEPRVEAHLAETLPEVHATILGARNHLAEMTEDEAATIEKRLQDDPELTMRIMERVDDYAKQVEVPIDQRTYLRTATLQLSGRFRYEGAKEVTSKLVAQYDRALAQRKSELGMMGDPDTGGPGASGGPAPAGPVRASFRTRASAGKVYEATCALEPKVTVDGVERPVVLDFEETRCRTTSSMKLSSWLPILGAVHMEPGENGQSLVTVELRPPPEETIEGKLAPSVASIAQELERRLAANQAGDTCATPAECGPLQCVDATCQYVRAKPSIATPTRPAPRLGSAGESCRSEADCESGLDCTRGACKPEHASRSERLTATTKRVAKVGAWTLIPPICAIGVLILLQCLFMVIVAGCIYEGNG